MASGASARTLVSLIVGLVTLAVIALPAGAGESGPDCATLTPTITGSNVGEWILGTEGDDIIRAGAGDDTITALGGDDVICAGPGNDTTRGGQGNDIVRSGRGNDISDGEAGDDFMRGQGDDDLADGGVGIDTCMFEIHEQCEADLQPDITGPASAFTGGSEVSAYNIKLTNHGPTAAVNSRVDITLPSGSAFVPGSSDSRCALQDATTIRCTFGAMGLELPDDADLGVTYTGCNARTPDLTAEANDPRTNDPVVPNTTDSLTTALSSSPTCSQAVDDAVTVPHDSGANTINVRANDINAADSVVGSTTAAAHGTVAITNGGANVSYTPANAYCGPDSFTYSLSPGGSTATVTIAIPCPTAVDDTYSAQAFPSATCPAGTLQMVGPDQYRVPVLTNDTNPAGAGPITVATVTQPTSGGDPHGTATIIENGAAILFERDGNYNDTDPPVPYTFTYTISPGGSQATVSITVDCFGNSEDL